jgi:uncharacterized protein
LFVNLKDVPPEGQVLDRSVVPDILGLDEAEWRVRHPVVLKGRLEPEDEGVFRLRGSLEVELDVTCVRCLEPFPVHLHEAIDSIYLPQSANVAPPDEEERGLRVDDMNVGFYRDDQIDLGHMVFEQIVLALPMKPLCKPDCLGLCPACGANRNVTPCDCSREEIDPRWAGLKNALGSREGD